MEHEDTGNVQVKALLQRLQVCMYFLLFLFSPTNPQHLSHQLLSIPPLGPAEIVRYWSML